MATLDTLGTPVEVAAIGKELKKLWAADQTRTRATLFNFAIVCQGESAMQSNTELLENFIGTHAFRAVLIGIEPGPDDSVKAWINARCYLPKAGAKHICSEQVSLFVRGNVRLLLPNLLFGQLDSDLPLTLLWRCDCPEQMDPEIWRWVDRLIFDLSAWSQPRQQLQALRRQLGNGRTVLCDLAWTRTLRLRQAIAQIFDASDNLSALAQVRNVRIQHAPGARASAVLFLGWLAAQLGWSAHGPSGNHLRMDGPSGGIVCELSEKEGAAISLVELAGSSLSVVATRASGVSFLQVSARNENDRTTEYIMPADCETDADLLDCELTTSGLHRVYAKALAACEAML
jgi:glucose-6-phosphate dehydrogenase assembly protein OpcA